MRFEAGYSKTPLHRKLGCKVERPIHVIGGPDGFAEHLRGEGFEVHEHTDVAAVPPGVGHVHLFSVSETHASAAMLDLSARIARDGQVWLSWPKKTSGVAHDIPKSLLHTPDAFGDLVDIKVCAVDAVWSGLKYVIRKERR